MTSRATSTRAGLPALGDVTVPPRYLLHPLRPAARAIVRRRISLTSHHEDRVPASGPVILAANHTGVLDGPLLVIFAPRPVHAMTKQEMFAGRRRPWMRATGQIELDRFHPDPRAVKTALRVLAEGRVAGIFPEGTRGAGAFTEGFHRGAAYLALVSGAPVVPVIMLGTRAPGGSSRDLPPRGGHVDLVYGEPWRVGPEPWPRTRQRVGEASAALRQHLLATLDDALASTGRTLPGPLPPGDKENR